MVAAAVGSALEIAVEDKLADWVPLELELVVAGASDKMVVVFAVG